MTTSQDREGGRRTCSRCGDLRYFAARFPDGRICQTCLSRALKTRGSCPGCGHERALIGRRAGTAVCRDCAGITRDFSCPRCGFEGDSSGRVCKRCKLAAGLAGLLDDGTGRICPALQPLADALTAAANPTSALAWVSKPRIRTLLADLAAGRTELTHQALAARPDWRAAVHLRGLLVSCGILPAADRHLLDYEAWLHRKLATLDGHPHQRLLREFSLWHQLTRMRSAAAARPLRPTARKYATDRFTAAETFRTWTAARGRRLADLTQADTGAFYLSHRTHQGHAPGTFLSWAMDRGHLPRHDLPATQYGTGEAITQQQRLALLRRFAAGDHGGLRPRAAACLMLLYAHRYPASSSSPPATSPLATTAGSTSASAPRPRPSPRRSPGSSSSSPPPATRPAAPAATAATGCSPACTRASPSPTRPCSSSSATSACRCAPRGPPHYASSSCKPPRPSSPTPSASTTPPPSGSAPTPAEPGTATPAPAATHQQPSRHRSPDHGQARRASTPR